MSLALGVLLQIAVSAQVPDTVPARTPVTLVLRATVPGNAAPTLTAPSAPGAAFQLMADVTRLGGGFGQAIATREMRYLMRADTPGTLQFGAVTATLGAQRATSEARLIVVMPPPTNAVPAIVSRAVLSRDIPVNFHSLVTPDTVWAGEQVTLQVGVFIDDELRSQLLRNPEYVAPSVEGAVAYDLPVANDNLPSRDVGGARYRPFVFARALFPLRAGVLQVPPARLVYALGAATMFGRQERQTATTEPRTVIVRELPAEGRPPGFAGAVGVYRATAQLERPTGRVGDAVQLSVRVEGVGNVKLLPPPVLDIPGVTVGSAGETIAVDSTDLTVRGSKTFRFLLTPAKAGALDLGAARYPYFNPVRGAYEEATAPIGTLQVAPGTAVALDDDTPDEVRLPLQAWSVQAPGDITESWLYRALFVALGAPWVFLLLKRARMRMPGRTGASAARHRAAGEPQAELTVASLRRTYLDVLGPLVHLRRDEAFEVPDVVRRLRRAGVSGDASEAAGALLLRLDRLTFGQRDSVDASLLRTLDGEVASVRQQLLRELSVTGQRRLAAGARRAVLLLVLLPGATLRAQSPAFREGLAAYRDADFARAAAAFARAAADQPRSVAAWTNLGAAQWMRADTAGAIVAWQRSVRLAPQDNRARDWLAPYAAGSEVRTAIMPMSPNVAWLLLLAVTAALSISGILWRSPTRRISNTALLTGTALVGSCALLCVATERSAAAAGLVVIRQEVALRAEPALAGESGARARGGEVAIITDSTDIWRYVTLPGGRAGWVESEALRSLALVDARDVALAEARSAAEGPGQ